MVAIFHFQIRFFFYLFILIFLGVNITGCGDSMVFKAPESMASSKAPGAAVSKTPETTASKVQNETSTQKGSRGSKFRVLTCSTDGTSVAKMKVQSLITATYPKAIYRLITQGAARR